MLTVKDKDSLSQVRGRIKELAGIIDNEFTEANNLAKEEEVRTSLSSAQFTWTEFMNATENEFFPAIFSGDIGKALGLANGAQKLRQNRFIEQIESIGSMVSVRVEEMEENAKKIVAEGMRFLLLCTLILISAVIAFALFISRSITKPIDKLIVVTGIIAKGDLTPEIDVNGKDEIGLLASAFMEMVRNLRDIINKVVDVSERVSSSSQELSSSAQQMNATAEEVSSTVQQIAKGATTQAQRVEETKKIMEQMMLSVEQVVLSSQNAAGQASLSVKNAQKGGEAAKDTKSKILIISETVKDSAAAVKKLGERSEQIGEIVNVITKIADQTNLLALNAAIEAARAGESGRGFAVVAEEVRKLAEGSAKAADEIGKLIKDVQKETAQAVANIESSAKESGAVKDFTQKVEDNLKEIIKSAEGVAAMIEQVSAASEQQALGSQQVTKSVSAIASVAEETASATQEASASTEQMTASMEEMAASAQDLADMGMTLNKIVGKFNISSSPGVKTAETRKDETALNSMKPKEKADAVVKRAQGVNKERSGK
jgi:methyl-accepting chemotaxis protein